LNSGKLQNLTFNGSGYDVAVALEAKPIIYSLKQQKPVYHPVVVNPAFADNLYFVYLGKKQHPFTSNCFRITPKE
jgi:hypothetical protein